MKTFNVLQVSVESLTGPRTPHSFTIPSKLQTLKLAVVISFAAGSVGVTISCFGRYL